MPHTHRLTVALRLVVYGSGSAPPPKGWGTFSSATDSRGVGKGGEGRKGAGLSLTPFVAAHKALLGDQMLITGVGRPPIVRAAPPVSHKPKRINEGAPFLVLLVSHQPPCPPPTANTGLKDGHRDPLSVAGLTPQTDTAFRWIWLEDWVRGVRGIDVWGKGVACRDRGEGSSVELSGEIVCEMWSCRGALWQERRGRLRTGFATAPRLPSCGNQLVYYTPKSLQGHPRVAPNGKMTSLWKTFQSPILSTPMADRHQQQPSCRAFMRKDGPFQDRTPLAGVVHSPCSQKYTTVGAFHMHILYVGHGQVACSFFSRLTHIPRYVLQAPHLVTI